MTIVQCSLGDIVAEDDVKTGDPPVIHTLQSKTLRDAGVCRGERQRDRAWIRLRAGSLRVKQIGRSVVRAQRQVRSAILFSAWPYSGSLTKSEDMPTLVACKTLAKRGKSLVPESRILMDESSNCMLERNDETQLERVLAVLISLLMYKVMLCVYC